MAKTDGMGNRFVLCVHDIHESECLKCRDTRIAALEAENGRLKAPVTEEEWDRNAVYGCNLVRGIDRISFRAILAARAQQPNRAQDKEQP